MYDFTVTKSTKLKKRTSGPRKVRESHKFGVCWPSNPPHPLTLFCDYFLCCVRPEDSESVFYKEWKAKCESDTISLKGIEIVRGEQDTNSAVNMVSANTLENESVSENTPSLLVASIDVVDSPLPESQEHLMGTDVHNEHEDLLHPMEMKLLGPLDERDCGKVCLVIDLDETLVHSSFEPHLAYHFVVEVKMNDLLQPVYVSKRPFVDEFLQCVASLFECVLFTASLSKYADLVVDQLDPGKSIFRYRLFREACLAYEDVFVKNLDVLGRPLDRVAILDNSPACYMLHKRNAIPVRTWYNDPEDTELLELKSFLEKLSSSQSVTQFLRENLSTPSKPSVFNYKHRRISADPRNTVFARGNRRY